MAVTTAATPDAAAGSQMGIAYFAVTGQGGRERNEDGYDCVCQGALMTFVVSDGMGGQAGGAMASAIVLETIRQQAQSLDRDGMRHGYQSIEQEIRQRQQQQLEYKHMGATVAELRIDANRQLALWGHFGDSRIYWLRNNEIMAVTGDHSVVKSLVAAGLISEHEAAVHPKKNVLLGAFGVGGDAEPEILAAPVHLADGDAFLVCTDGLWNCVPDRDILALRQSASSVEHWVRQLESRVKASAIEDKDNYTAIGVWITPVDQRTLRLDGL